MSLQSTSLSILTTLASLGLCAGTATAQNFQFTDFSSMAGMSLRGNAVQAGTDLRLTDLASNQTGNAWWATPVPVLAGFDTTFTFTITPGPTLAEGMAFIIQNAVNGANTSGGSIWGLGYGGGANGAAIANSIAIELDTFRDGFLNDTSNNEISIHTRGTAANSENEQASIGRTTPATFLSNSQQHTMRIRYVPGTMDVFVNNLTTPILSVPYDFTSGGTLLTGQAVGGLSLPNATAFVGFGSATGAGGLTERVLIHSWSWTSSPGTPPCADGTVGVGAGGPFDILSVNGDTGGYLRHVETPSFDPFTFDVAAPPANPSANFLMFGTIGNLQTGAITPSPWGDFCFVPIAPIQFGLGPAPLSIPFPAGIPLLGEITLQLLINVDSTNPSAIELSNAVTVEFVTPEPLVTGTVTPLSAPAGTQATLGGSGFSPALQLTINGQFVAPISIQPTSIAFAFPAGLPCDSTGTVTNPDGQQATFVINPTPTILNTVNNSGPAAGGALFIVTGNGFATGTTATIGGAPATINSVGPGVVVMSTPPGAVGPATVIVTTPGGCSASTTYTYL